MVMHSATCISPDGAFRGILGHHLVEMMFLKVVHFGASRCTTFTRTIQLSKSALARRREIYGLSISLGGAARQTRLARSAHCDIFENAHKSRLKLFCRKIP